MDDNLVYTTKPSDNRNRRPYKPKSNNPIIDTSKEHARDLIMHVGEDMPRIEKMLQNIMDCNESKNPNAKFQVEKMTEHAHVKWTDKKGNNFGFKVQICPMDKVLLESVKGTVDEPNFFDSGYNMMYIFEGEGLNIPITVKPPDRTKSRFTMYIAAGEHELMNELKKIFDKLYPGKSDDVVKMRGLRCGGDVNWAFVSTGERVGPTVERKRNDDMISSLSDGRKVQLPIMLANAPKPSLVFYIVEGNLLDTKSQTDEKAKIGTIVYPLLREGVSVASVSTTANTAALLANMHLYMESKSDKDLQNKQFLYGKMVNQGVTVDTYIGPGGRDELIYTLTRIKGISDPIAKAVSDKYNTFGNLMIQMVDSMDPVLMLEDLPVERDATSKKLGKANAKKIVDKYGVDEIRKWIKLTKSSTLNHSIEKTDNNNNNNNNNTKLEEEDNITIDEEDKPVNPPPLKKQKMPGPVFKAAVEAFQKNQELKEKQKNDPTPPPTSSVKWKEPKPKFPGPVFEKAAMAAAISKKRKAEEHEEEEIKEEIKEEPLEYPDYQQYSETGELLTYDKFILYAKEDVQSGILRPEFGFNKNIKAGYDSLKKQFNKNKPKK